MPRRYYRRTGLSSTRNRNKPATPLARFNFNENYLVAMPAPGAAPQNGAMLEMNLATPFASIDTAAGSTSGSWVPMSVSTTSQPEGIDADIYTQYRHLIVLAARVKVTVRDSVDLPATTNKDQLEGTVSLVRTSDTGVISSTDVNHQLRNYFQCKQKGFVMGSASVNAKTWNATLVSGYSAKRTFYSNPVSNQDLWVDNVAGSSNTPTDSTWMTLMIRPSSDTLSNFTLKDFRVTINISYLIRFIEPKAAINIPLPLSPPRLLYNNSTRTRVSRRKKYVPSLSSKANYLAKLGAAAYMADQAYQGYRRYNRYRNYQR